jgi:AcrR family transcriptional regulator
MPPIPDKHLEERILKAAQRLWHTRGESGVTLREVARAAGTTTPTIYQRFRDKAALERALALRIRDELNAAICSSTSPEEACRRHLQYAETHPLEYRLLSTSWPTLSPDVPRPARAWLLTQLAARFGGQPQEYSQIYYVLFLLCHGAATLLATEGDAALQEEMRENCIRVCEKTIENVAAFRVSSGGPGTSGNEDRVPDERRRGQSNAIPQNDSR